MKLTYCCLLVSHLFDHDCLDLAVWRALLTRLCGVQVESNILAQFPHTSEYMIARGFVIVVLVFSFPLIFFPLRVTLHNLLTSLFNLTPVDPRTVLVTNPLPHLHLFTLISLPHPCTTSLSSHCLMHHLTLISLPHPCTTSRSSHLSHWSELLNNSKIRQRINSNFTSCVMDPITYPHSLPFPPLPVRVPE